MRTGTLSPCSESRIALAVDRPRRTIERSQEAVAEGLHLPSAEARKLPAHRLIMSIEKVAPGSIAIGAGATGRVDDILEDHGREHPVDLRGRSRTCQKLLHLREYSVAGVEKREMVSAGISTNRALGMPAASSRPPSTLTNVSSVRWITRVGTLME
jgi:hypothetical protein